MEAFNCWCLFQGIKLYFASLFKQLLQSNKTWLGTKSFEHWINLAAKWLAHTCFAFGRWGFDSHASSFRPTSIFYKGAIPATFFFIYVFLVQLTLNNVQYTFCWWLDSNRGSLVLEATALPTVPQPLHNFENWLRWNQTRDCERESERERMSEWVMFDWSRLIVGLKIVPINGLLCARKRSTVGR